MTSLYQSLLIICFQALIPNPHTVQNLPEHQQMYIIKAVTKVCEEELRAEKLMMCVEQNFVPEEC